MIAAAFTCPTGLVLVYACVHACVGGLVEGVGGGLYFVSRLLLYPLPLLSSDLPPVLLLNIVLL